MKMRMQPIAKVFNKFPRMVRDLARSSGKEIDLQLSGEETELDKTVIEEIGDPLIHLIRNSADHGIEHPDEREAAGKPRTGTISLSAMQEGQNIVVCVEDDGKGIDPEKIKESAIKKGIIQPEEAARLERKDIFDLIFRPGFSTAKTVSDISGRGVGMDVVKTGISNINGMINIDSTSGKGTQILLRLPLTLAIIQILIVKSGPEIYGIPLANVIENIRVHRNEVKTIEGRDVIRIRERVLPVARLDSLVRGPRSYDNAGAESIYIVIIGVGEKRFGLLVDELYGQEEIVMKSMGEFLKGTQGVAGASITGDGKVVLILDAASALLAGEQRPALAS
jgi:two-component system chemotaxis sensor kinase CheA